MQTGLYFDMELNCYVDCNLVDMRLVEKYGDVLIQYGNTIKWVKFKHVIIEKYIVNS